MRHKVKKIKFKFGKDANKMLARKLAFNFLANGYLMTTVAKAKVLKSYIEKLISKVKKSKKGEKVLFEEIGSNVKLIKNLPEIIKKSFSDISGGYVRITKTDLREGDGSLLAKVEWAHPILTKEEKSQIEVKKTKIDKK